MAGKNIVTKGSVPFSKLLREVAARSGITTKTVRLVVETLVDVVKEQLYEGKSISLPTLGSFTLRLMKGRLYPVVLKGKVGKAAQHGTVYAPDRLSPIFLYNKEFKKQIQKDTAYELKMLDLEDLIEGEENDEKM